MIPVSEYTHRLFGEKAYRLSLDGGFTCPNRDGTCGTGGCSFCRGGSADFSASALLPIDEQVNEAKARISAKYKGSTFIAYFQSFTNTYAPAALLRKRFEAVMRKEDIAALSVATRPDCLNDDVLSLLGELNGIKPVWVELGLQTAHDETARRLNRGYDTAVYDAAVPKLNALGIHTVTHLILSLPGETGDMMIESARHAAEAGTGGLKIQMLNILRDTPLAEEYERDPFPLLTLDEYAKLTAEIIRMMPGDTVLHRMTGDGARQHLIAPRWITDKKRVLNTIRKDLLLP